MQLLTCVQGCTRPVQVSVPRTRALTPSAPQHGWGPQGCRSSQEQAGLGVHGHVHIGACSCIFALLVRFAREPCAGAGGACARDLGAPQCCQTQPRGQSPRPTPWHPLLLRASFALLYGQVMPASR